MFWEKSDVSSISTYTNIVARSIGNTNNKIDTKKLSEETRTIIQINKNNGSLLSVDIAINISQNTPVYVALYGIADYHDVPIDVHDGLFKYNASLDKAEFSCHQDGKKIKDPRSNG